MSEYILILAWIGLMGILASRRELNRTEIVCGKPVKRLMPWFAFLTFLPIIIMAGVRGWFGDTASYVGAFRRMPSSIFAIPEYIADVEKDKGFYLFSALLKQIIGNNYRLYLTIVAAIQASALVVIFRKYSISYLWSIFFFVISTDYVGWMFNGIRQFMAVILIFSATKLMLDKRYMATICVILIASTMHQSALIMIPILFIAQGKAWNDKTLMFIAIALLGITFIGEFTDLLDSGLADTQYSYVVSDIKQWQDDGTNPLRVLVYSIPTILAFIGRKQIRSSEDPLVHFCTNMSIVSTGIYIISMFTSGIYMGRLPIYASLYGYMLLPWEIDHLFTRQSKKIVCLGLLGMYALFYYYQMHMTWGLF